MNPAPEPRWLDNDGVRLFSVLHRPAAAVRAGVLVCPPLFHEHAISYRLFVLLADALAAHGVMVLRFHYHGTGDSDGEDSDFTLPAACRDSERALDALRAASGAVPVAVLGVRAGAIPAIHVATTAGVDALWLWQPRTCGADYLAELQRIDAERPRLHARTPAPGDGTLVGLRCAATLRDELRAARAVPPDASGPDLVVLDAAGSDGVAAPGRRIELAPALHAWADGLGMTHFPRGPLRELGQRLAAMLD